MSKNGRHSRLRGKLCDSINRVSEESKIAYAFPRLQCSFGNRSIIPDISVFRWEQIPFTGEGDVPDRFELPPDWVIEILSPEQKANKAIGNISYCLDFDSRLGWFLDPDDLSILVFQPQQQPRLSVGTDQLPVLDGIELNLTVDQVYGWLKMQSVLNFSSCRSALLSRLNPTIQYKILNRSCSTQTKVAEVKPSETQQFD